MNKQPGHASPDAPLRGVRVLVGRARHQAGALSTALRYSGAEVLEIPFIQIKPPRSFRPLDTALKALGTYDWLILTSVNGVDAMWERLDKIKPATARRVLNDILADKSRVRIAAIGPATRKSIERHDVRVDVVPKEYVAESVVRSLKSKAKGKRVLLVRAKVARDVIPRELRKAGAHVDVVEAYETVVPRASRAKLRAALKDEKNRPDVITFTSSSTVKNFVELLGIKGRAMREALCGIHMSSIGPITSATLRELGLSVDIKAKEFTIPGLVQAIEKAFSLR
jgi:uroporphyrinogen-III synthase